MDIRKVYPKRVGPTTLTTSAVAIFTADKRYGIERFVFTNWSAADATVTLHIVTSGGSVGNGNKVMGGQTVTANDQTTVQLPIILEVGEAVYALCSATSSVNLTFLINDVEINLQ